jgi:hypothetical protein
MPGEVSEDNGDILELALFDGSIGEPITSGADTTLWDGIDLRSDGDEDGDQDAAEPSVEAASKNAVTSGSDSSEPERKKRKGNRKKHR